MILLTICKNTRVINHMLSYSTLLKNTVFTLLLALVTVLLVNCGASDDDDGSSQASASSAADVDVEAVKTHYVAMASAMYADSLIAAQALQTAIYNFIDNPSETTLTAAKAAYKSARIPYQQSEILRWDTAFTLSSNLGVDGGPTSVDDWEGQVNAWPLDENFIVGIIQGSDAITTDLLISQNGANDNEANVTTGVHAVEFMLWGQDTNGTGPGAGTRPASDFANDGSCADAFCTRRAEYLRVAIDLLVADLTEMTAEWRGDASITQGTLAYNFLNNDFAVDYIVGSMTAMATDELASARMGSGLTLGDPEEEHDCFSDLSHVAIYYNFQGVRNAFYGTYGNLTGPSIASLVTARDQNTFNTIDTAFNSIEEKMLAILNAGENPTNTVRFDQIIGQPANGTERQTAEAAVDELVALEANFQQMQTVLELTNVDTSGGGD